MDWDLIVNPPAFTTDKKDAYYKSLTTEQILENNAMAAKQAVEAPTDKTLVEYYSSLKQPWD